MDTDENVNREELEKRDDPAVSAALNKKKKRRNNNNKRGGKNCCSGTIIQIFGEAVLSALVKKGSWRGKRILMSVAILSVCGLVRMMGDHNISVSFLQHVKALEHCPDQVSQALIDTYDIGTKVTREGTVYECTAKSPSYMWKIIGSCEEVSDIFVPSSQSQPTVQSLIFHPSMLPTTLVLEGIQHHTSPTDYSEDGDQILPPKPSNKDSNDLQQQSINILGERKLINPLSQRVRHHKTPHTTPDINRQEGEVSTDNGLSQPYHPDWYMTKCINDPVTDNKPLVYSTVEECCELW